jgi:hypothetical protein
MNISIVSEMGAIATGFWAAGIFLFRGGFGILIET